VHVKGHSADGGNDRADELVQWGKTGGPYCRGVREVGGEGEAGGDGDGGRLGDGANLRICPGEAELWGG
jgi:hypothetical protein